MQANTLQTAVDRPDGNLGAAVDARGPPRRVGAADHEVAGAVVVDVALSTVPAANLRRPRARPGNIHRPIAGQEPSDIGGVGARELRE